MEPIEKFIAIYSEKLKECVQSMPDQYFYKVADVDKVVQKMKLAFIGDSYNISGSPAIKKTCKALGINYTRKAIKAFLSNTEHTCPHPYDGTIAGFIA